MLNCHTDLLNWSAVDFGMCVVLFVVVNVGRWMGGWVGG